MTTAGAPRLATDDGASSLAAATADAPSLAVAVISDASAAATVVCAWLPSQPARGHRWSGG